MQPAVSTMLVGVPSRLTLWATLKTRVLRGFKSSRRTAPQSGASPQQAESLAAGARPFFIQPNHYAILV
ncbi:hypothetical protein ABN16_07425 [Levilactobacillus koreensis]|uniref:Uncharacterized protein n=1 Tax=Levilactobacillus koreensis TaxID=637971 RepID=A0AAC8ZGK0_9LACO|nr:hypothetical protein ABN16_07425 [Levilactobacillus koreensis]